ncbi:hypothetical protein RF11_11411 [Thelohanellus kitauei]|uniref:Integrase catalytic domain-containing protein n=1 Tax=Thelohanellus kitauei TaxID=669202 RepID=A0A0C2JDK8_THEKT|nr:hypothetical protein RF11_11411 [Thelohanellus kitauei]
MDFGGQLGRYMNFEPEYKFTIDLPESHLYLFESQKRYPVIRKFLENLKSNFADDYMYDKNYVVLKRIRKSLIIRNDTLYSAYYCRPGSRLRYVVPNCFKKKIMSECHDNMGLYWHYMRHDIKNWCDSCEECCKRNNPHKYTHQPMIGNSSTFTWKRVGMDITGPLPLSIAGFCYIFESQNIFSKFLVTSPLENITANNNKVFLDEFAFKFRMPISVHTDIGNQFQ